MTRTRLLRWAAIAALALFAVTVIGVAQDAIADNMAETWLEKQAPEPLVTAQVMRGTRRPVNPAIVVSRHVAGRVFRPGSMITVSFQVDEKLMRQPIFQLRLLKGRAHRIKATWMGSSRIDPPRTYQSQWRIPPGFETGTDYFVCVEHLPTKNKGCSGLFTIR